MKPNGLKLLGEISWDIFCLTQEHGIKEDGHSHEWKQEAGHEVITIQARLNGQLIHVSGVVEEGLREQIMNEIKSILLLKT